MYCNRMHAVSFSLVARRGSGLRLYDGNHLDSSSNSSPGVLSLFVPSVALVLVCFSSGCQNIIRLFLSFFFFSSSSLFFAPRC